MTFFVYILRCYRNPKDRSNNKHKFYFYKGYTNDIKRRYLEHKQGYSKYTKRYKGRVEVVYIEIIKDKSKKIERTRAIRRELQIKKWSRKKIAQVIKLKQQKIKVLIDLYLN